MSRNYANILTAVWREADWRRLSSDAQRTYMMLFSQPDISAAGVLALTVGRWSACAANTSAGSIRADLAELEHARFVIVDYDHEELLVRTFVKWDGGYGNEKRRPVILRAALDVGSPILRASLAEEFARLGLPTDGLSSGPPPDRPSGSPSDRASDRAFTAPADGPPEALKASTSWDRPAWNQPTPATGFAQVNSPSDRASDSPSDGASASDGVVVTKGPYLLPQPTTHKPQPPAPAALPALADGATPTQRSQAITDAYYAVEPMSKWPAVNAIVTKAIKAGRWSDQQIHDALQRLAADHRGVTIETLRVELTGPPASRASLPRTTLVERNGMQLKPETAQRLDDRQKWRDRDAASQRLALGGTA